MNYTGTAPTGYSVTFRYYDPGAQRVEVNCDCFYSSPADSATNISAALYPWQWKPGDFVQQNPERGPTNDFPLLDMKLDSSTGIWSLTVPFPSGIVSYGFYVNCDSSPPNIVGCTRLADPNNLPWNSANGTTVGSTEPNSTIYVPSDPRFGTDDVSWEAPARVNGKLVDVSYPSSVSTGGTNNLAIYTPAGYNPHRTPAYPTLYLEHGAGGNEVDWSTTGAASTILEDAISTHQAQPMVVVMMNSAGASFQQDMLDNVIPYVEANYNVSTSPNNVAIAGLSMGGAATNGLLFNATSDFGYYGSFSIGNLGAPATTDPAWQNPALKTRLGIMIGGGLDDPITVPGIDTYEASLAAAGIQFKDDRVYGGHTWITWRAMLHDFVTQVAFRTTAATLSENTSKPGVFTASVQAATTEPAPVTGLVEFYIDGNRAGTPYALGQNGTVTVDLSALAGPGTHQVTAEYEGDDLYNDSLTSSIAFSQ